MLQRRSGELRLPEEAKYGGGGVDEANEPFVMLDAEFYWEGKIRAVRSGVVPTPIKH